MEIFELDPLDITVPERQRHGMEQDGLDKLADSINRLGQLQPIYLTRDKVLVYGGRRRAACEKLHINVKCAWVDEVDEITLQEMELEENLQREDLHWADVVAATDKIHKLKETKFGKSYPGARQDVWTQAKTADLLGISSSEVGARLQLADAIRRVPDLAKAKTESDALKLMARARESLILKELAKRAEEQKASTLKTYPARIIKGDCMDETTGLPAMKDNCVGCFCMDPPYGIDLHNVKHKSASTITSYTDISGEEFLSYMRGVLKQCYRIARSDSFLYVWVGFQHFNPMQNIIRDIGWEVWPCAFVWHHTGTPGQCNQPSRWPANVCELCIFARKGSPALAREGMHNHLPFTINPKDKIHPTEKPVELMVELLSRVAYPTMLVCDPFAGSGSTLIAATRLKLMARGWEKDEDFAAAAMVRIMAEMAKIEEDQRAQIMSEVESDKPSVA